ncbi:MAG: hypothetical protein L6R42_004856, partial [Xanthoria sp. 1 TBL-2021]
NGRADPPDAAGAFEDPAHDPQALPPFSKEAIFVRSNGARGYPFTPAGDVALGELANCEDILHDNFHHDSSHHNTFSQEDFLDTLFAADILQSMVNDNGPSATRHTPDSPTGSNPFEHSSNPPTTGIANTGFVFGNDSLANTSFDFDFDFHADFDAFIGAPNLASYMASRQEPSFDGFANFRDDDTDVAMGATIDPADLEYNDNDNINNNNNNNNSAAFTPLTYAYQQQNNDNDNDTTATPSPIDLFLERESPFIFGNTANRFTNFVPRVELPPTPFTPLSSSLKRRRSHSSPTSSPTLPNRRRRTHSRLAPAPAAPALGSAPSLSSFSTTTTSTLTTVTLLARFTRFLEDTGIPPAALSQVLKDVVLYPHVPLTKRSYRDILGDGRVVVVVEGLEREEISVWVE